MKDSLVYETAKRLALYLNMTKFKNVPFEAEVRILGEQKNLNECTLIVKHSTKNSVRLHGEIIHTGGLTVKDEKKVSAIVHDTVKDFKPQLVIVGTSSAQYGYRFFLELKDQRGEIFSKKVGILEFLSYEEFLNENETGSPRDLLREFVCGKMTNFLTRRMGPLPTTSMGDKRWKDIVEIFVKNNGENSIRFSSFELWNEYVNYTSKHKNVDPDELLALVEHNAKSFSAKKGWTCEIEQDDDVTIVTVYSHDERGAYIAGKTGII